MKMRLLLTSVLAGGMLLISAPSASACHTEEPHTPQPTVQYIVNHLKACIEE